MTKEENQRPVKKLRGNKIAIITANALGHHMLVIRAPGPTPSAQKQWKSDVHVKS